MCLAKGARQSGGQCKSCGIKTSEVGKQGVTVAKLGDSFRNGENPR